MVILRGWAEAPLSPGFQGQSPGAQGKPTVRATTLKAKSPRALLKGKAGLTSPTGASKEVYKPPSSSNIPLCSSLGLQQVAHPTSTGTPPLPTQPRIQAPEFGALPGGTKSRPGFLTRDSGGWGYSNRPMSTQVPPAQQLLRENA